MSDWYDFGWWTDGRVSALGQMVGGLGTVGTFVFAFRLFGKQRTQLDHAETDRARSEEERKRSQAESVAAWVGMHQVTVKPWLGEGRGDGLPYDAPIDEVPGVLIRNVSSAPVYSCHVVVGERPYGVNASDGFGDEYEPANIVHVLAPGETLSLPIEQPERFNEVAVELYFTDSAERRWRRGPWGGLYPVEIPEGAC